MITQKSEKEKRREEIVDIGMKIIHFWLKNPSKSLTWVLKELGKI